MAENASSVTEVPLMVNNTLEQSEGLGTGHRHVCGLWLDNLAHGLQWERIDPGRTARVPGIPTCSWASIATCPLSSSNDGDGLGGLPVRWAAATGSLDRGTPLLRLGRTGPAWLRDGRQTLQRRRRA